MLRNALVLTLLLGTVTAAGAQTATTAAKKTYAPVCAKGVQIFDKISQVPTPHDSLTMPPGEPIRVTNEAEAEAAELALRARAGKVGATGVVVSTQQVDDGDGRVTMSRRVQAVYVAADSARAQKACVK